MRKTSSPIYKFNMFLRDIKHAWQKLTRGFSDEALWSLDYHLAEIITPRLKAFKNSTRHGTPVLDEDDTVAQKKWEEILDKMIWAFENYKKEDYCFTDTGELKLGDPDADGTGTVLSTGLSIDTELYDEHHRKIAEGLKLFAEYFGMLWD